MNYLEYRTRSLGYLLMFILVLSFPISAQQPADQSGKARDQKAIDDAVNGWWTASIKTHDQRIGWWREAKCDAVTSYNHSADKFRVEGAKGWLELKEHAFTYRGIVAKTSRGRLNYAAINQQAAQMDDFADCIITGRDTPVLGELGRRDMQIITAIYEAARPGNL